MFVSMQIIWSTILVFSESRSLSCSDCGSPGFTFIILSSFERIESFLLLQLSFTDSVVVSFNYRFRFSRFWIILLQSNPSGKESFDLLGIRPGVILYYILLRKSAITLSISSWINKSFPMSY